MANPTIETVSTGADKAKLAGVAVLVVGAVVAFYALGQQDLWVRVLALLALIGVANAASHPLGLLCTGVGTIADLGVTNLETVEAITPTYLWRHRPHGQFQPPRVDEASRVDA